jgi:hypothetical protein
VPAVFLDQNLVRGGAHISANGRTGTDVTLAFLLRLAAPVAMSGAAKEGGLQNREDVRTSAGVGSAPREVPRKSYF